MMIIYKCFHVDLLTGEKCGATKEQPYGICPKCHRFPIEAHLKIIRLAEEIYKLQATKNRGQGCECVRSIVAFLHRGDIDHAKFIYDWDGDKVCGTYPDIDKAICTGLGLKPRYGEFCHWEYDSEEQKRDIEARDAVWRKQIEEARNEERRCS